MSRRCIQAGAGAPEKVPSHDVIHDYVLAFPKEEFQKYKKRVHSKAWHYERNRRMKTGCDPKVAQEKAAEFASAAQARWEKAVAGLMT